MMDAFAIAQSAAAELRARSGFDGYDVAIVLGSGWREGADALGSPLSTVATTSLPGFSAPTVPGHEGRILSLEVAGRRVALVAGRVHLYEGNSANAVAHPVRTAVMAGARRVVLTNASGGIDPSYAAGSVVMISDHLNLTATSPLEGDAPPSNQASRFVDLSDLYNARLRELVRNETGLAEGVYAGLRGPHYETPAEVRMLAAMGAGMVGMSTVLEAIAARHLGAEVLGLSLVTNPAAGVSSEALNHLEVLEAGQRAAATLGELLARIVPLL